MTESLLQELGAALNRAGNPVTSLQLSMTGIADGGSRIIAGWLRSEECSLQELDLSLNEMSEAGMLEIAEALSSESSKLLALNLSLQKSDSGASVKTLEAFTKSLES
ncbi:MAG: hypothetical protein Q8P67_29305, partial [archaeon]|nr:hypothetical protein [archaeon]